MTVRAAGVGSLATFALLLAATALPLSPARSQPNEPDLDLSALHARAVYATVLVRNGHDGMGTGWMLQQREGLPPIIVTNRHVVDDPRRRRTYGIEYYQGTDAPPAIGAARLSFATTEIDLAFLIPTEAPPADTVALQLEPGEVHRGERVVLAGNPEGLFFQTTEGVVTGATHGAVHAFRCEPHGSNCNACGRGRNCIVVDAASFSGSSGGPALNARGRLVGMLYGGPNRDLESETGPIQSFWTVDSSFAFLIHVRVIEEVLRLEGERRRAASR